MDDRGRRK
jgi:hypothetical protein